MDMPAAIRAVTDSVDLSTQDMSQVMQLIMTGDATPAQVGGFLIGLRMKGETVDEIVAAAQVMRDLSTKVAVTGEHLIDTCGTGGDGVGTFNISTAAAFVAAAAGAQVAKHGNRSVSSRSGSADVLEAAGVRIDLSAEQVAKCVTEIGVGFMFAPLHHSAMKHAIGPRKEMAVRTVFNILGPLTNPANALNQVLGVFDKAWLNPLASVLMRLGSQHVLVVHAEDGMDEISIGAPTDIVELKNNAIQTYRITPEQFGLLRGDVASLRVDSAQASLKFIEGVFNNNPGPARDIVVLNAGAAIYAAGLATDLASGIDNAKQVIESGAAKTKWQALIDFSQQLMRA